MDGGSLANVLNQVGPIPEKVLASIAYQILWGLAYLKHEKRVHRDMKPSNLLINSQGEVKVHYYLLFFKHRTVDVCLLLLPQLTQGYDFLHPLGY